ncbi:MAG: recombinase family protein [Lachnospiraceae bacterium]|nr:recombinase family protein [Lachnospiraceae bacterium]
MVANRRVALYLRLSQEDEDLDETKRESNSVTNQRNLMRQYIKDHSDLTGKEVVEYADDGFSGTNFSRPEFNRMIKDVMYGNIECVIVKDLSRFGRNYIESGNYLEKIFPLCNVRFISINDHFDSDDYKGVTGGINMAFKNFMNTMYSKDISQKVTVAMRTRAEAGQFLAPFPAYGYRKNPEKIHQLIIDEEAAGVVRKIFRMAADGIGKHAIARCLNEEGVVTPVVYMNAHGINKRAYKEKEKKLWTHSTVADMIRNEVYLGKIIWNKSRRAEVGSHRQIKLPREQWIIIEGCHEAIVTRELFDEANAHAFTGEKRMLKQDKTPGLFSCGSCRRRMTLNGNRSSYRCTQAAITGLEECKQVKKNRYILEDEILTSAKEKAIDELVLLRKNIAKWKHDTREWKGTETLQNKVNKLADKKMHLYDAYKSGKLNKIEYLEQVQIVTNKQELNRTKLEQIYRNSADAEYNLSASVEQEARLVQVKKLEKYDTKVLRLVLNEVVIYPDGGLEYHWKDGSIIRK